MGSNDISRDVSQKRFLVKNIAVRVTLGLEAYEDRLRLRRKKLKLLIDEENNELFRELKQHEKLKIDLVIQMQKDAVEALEHQKAKEKEELMAKKLLQLNMAKCKDLQPLLKKRREMETQYIQQQQIKEMQEKRNHEKEVDNMWFYIMKNDSEAKREKEEREQMERHQKEMERKKCLDAQVQIVREAQKKRELADKEETDKLLDSTKKKTEKIISKETQRHTDAKTSLSECLKLQMSIREENIKKSKEEEKAFECSLAKVCLIEQQEEMKKKIADKANQKHQIEIFGKHALAIKAEREARERAEDLMVAEVAKKRSQECENQRILLMRKSKSLLKDALVGREAQMEEKRKAAEAAARKAAEEVEVRKQREKLLAEEWKQEKERDVKAKAAYKQYLEEQMNLAKVAKEREQAKLMEDFRNKLIKEKEFNEKMLQLMKLEFSTEGVHPFLKAMNQKSPTERSYCPKIPETAYFKY